MNRTIKRHQEQFIGNIKAFIFHSYKKELVDLLDNVWGDGTWDRIMIEETGLSLDDYGSKEDTYRDKITLFIESERSEIVLTVLSRLMYYMEKDRILDYKKELVNFIEYANHNHIMHRKMDSDVQFMKIGDIKNISDALDNYYPSRSPYKTYYDMLIKDDTMHFTDTMIYKKIAYKTVQRLKDGSYVDYDENVYLGDGTDVYTDYEYVVFQKSLSEVLETLNYISEEYVIQLVEYLYTLEYRRNRDIKSTLEEILKPYKYAINDDNKIIKDSYIAPIQALQNVSLEDILIITDSEIGYTHPHFGKKTYSLERKAGGRNDISKNNQIFLMLAIDKHYDIRITEKDLINTSDAVSKQLGIPSDMIREYLRKKANNKSIIIYK